MARFSLYQLLKRERGAAVIEFALIAPLFFLIIWAILAFGQGYSRLNVLTGALRAGGRIASTRVDPCGADKAEVDSVVSKHSMAFGAHVDVSLAAYAVTCANPGEVRVGVTNYPLFVGLNLFGMDSMLVTRVAIFRKELP